MSLTSFDSMPASQELDALVAERVMGWTRLTDGHCEECEAMIADGAVMMRDPEQLVGVVLEYSSSIAAAWPILEKFGFIIGPSFRGGAEPLSSQRTGWFVYRSWLHSAEDTYEEFDSALARADTAPLAICRAALKAVNESP